MQVALCEITFYLHGARTLKDKRATVRRIIERTRARFDLAISETAEQDVHQRARIGFAAIGPDRRSLESLTDRIIQFIDELFVAERIGLEREILSWKGHYE